MVQINIYWPALLGYHYPIEDPEQHSEALTKVATALSAAGKPQEAKKATEEAVAAARAIKDPEQHSEALTKVATALSAAGNLQEARRAVEKAGDTAKQISDDSKRSEAHAEVATAWAKLHFYYYAMEAAALSPLFNDKLAAYTAIVREYTKELNANLAKIIEAEEKGSR